jgi:hypothetical protein
MRHEDLNIRKIPAFAGMTSGVVSGTKWAIWARHAVPLPEPRLTVFTSSLFPLPSSLAPRLRHSCESRNLNAT